MTANLALMTNYYEENQKRLIEELKATQSHLVAEPFAMYFERREAFETFLHDPDGIPNCGCGESDSTLQAVLDALDYCALKDSDVRQTFLKEKFGVDYVSNNRLVQLLFYVLDDKAFIEHNFTINGSYLTDAGKALRAILTMYLNEPTTEQIANKIFGIDFNTALAG